MSHDDDQNTIDEDAYVIEDSGESLENFDLEREEAAARSEGEGEVEAAAPGAMGMAVSETELTRLRNENAQMKDRLLRARADFDNFRKRAEREKADFYKYALTDMVRELLPVIDNFERALSAKTDSAPDLLAGIELIYKQLCDVLAKSGLQVVEDVPAPFDPAFHEAVTREENPGVPNHTVTEVLQKGYVLNERLIRPAMVRVAVGGPEPAKPAGLEQRPDELARDEGSGGQETE